jgi:hypothetical protein
MASNLLNRTPDEVLHGVLEHSDGETYVVEPTGEVVECLVEVAADFDGALPDLRLIAEGRTVRRVMEDFLVASSAADLVESGHLSIRTAAADRLSESVIVTESRVTAVVSAGGYVAGISTDDDAFVDDAYAAYGDYWADAEAFQLRTPPISRVRETLGEEVSAEAEADFSRVLSSLETARGNGDGLDEVTISLLVAAKNDQLFYDISRWGEDVGVASKATFSRMKNELEDTGLIDTEKVPVDVGRPRQRLTLEDDRLKQASSDQVAAVAESILN